MTYRGWTIYKGTYAYWARCHVGCCAFTDMIYCAGNARFPCTLSKMKRMIDEEMAKTAKRLEADEGVCRAVGCHWYDGKCHSYPPPPPPPPPPEYTLDIITMPGGTTNPAPGSYIYPENTTVKVTAIPDEGYNLDHWILDGIEYTSNPITIVMNSNHTLTAYFSEEPVPPPDRYNLTIITTEGGTTEPTPDVYEVNAGIIITVKAIAYSGYKFKRFELDGEVKMQNPINVGMDADHTLLAVFKGIAPPIGLKEVAIGVAVVASATGVGYIITRKKK